MNAADCIQALELPASALVDQRVPKKTLATHGAANAAARRQIQEGIDELRWVAALKPSTCGVPAHTDEDREYLEIAVLRVSLRPAGKPGALLPLIHRAIPYPVVLVGAAPDGLSLSLAHKRWSQAEKGLVVVDGELTTLYLDDQVPEENLGVLLSSLSLAKQPRATLYDLYEGWLDTVLAMQAAPLLGDFQLPRSREHAQARKEALRECARLESEIAALRAAAEREKQVPRRVELNLELKRIEAAHAEARKRL